MKRNMSPPMSRHSFFQLEDTYANDPYNDNLRRLYHSAKSGNNQDHPDTVPGRRPILTESGKGD